MFGSVGRLVGTNTKSSELVFSGLLDSLCSLLPASVMFESSVATAIQETKSCAGLGDRQIRKAFHHMPLPNVFIWIGLGVFGGEKLSPTINAGASAVSDECICVLLCMNAWLK